MTKVAIIGTGQQGSAMAMSFADAGYDIEAYSRSEKTRLEFKEVIGGRKNINIYDDLIKTVKYADIVMLATPIDKYAEILRAIDGHVKDGVIITDIGSGKVKAINEMQSNLPKEAILIPAHILTGRAGFGPKSAEEGMYKGAVCVIIPQGEAFKAEQEKIEKLWHDVKAKISYMQADTHDRLYGMISHFYRMVAHSLMACGEDPIESGRAVDEYKRAGNYMLDITRTANSSTHMWLAIFADNREAILEAASLFENNMQDLKNEIYSGDTSGLKSIITNAHNYRKNIKEPRARESIQGEIDDLVQEFGRIDLSAQFNAQADNALVKRTLVPTVIAATLTLSLRDMEDKYFKDIDLFNIITPAFKDGVAPMLNDPDYIAKLLLSNGDELISYIEEFETNLKALTMAVDLNYKPFMIEYLEGGTSIRKTLPPHKNPDEMREKYIIEVT